MHQCIGIHAICQTSSLHRLQHLPRGFCLNVLASSNYDIDQVGMLPHPVGRTAPSVHHHLILVLIVHRIAANILIILLQVLIHLMSLLIAGPLPTAAHSSLVVLLVMRLSMLFVFGGMLGASAQALKENYNE
jgi:hypothetical protein